MNGAGRDESREAAIARHELGSRLGILAIFLIGVSVGICLAILYQDAPKRLREVRRALPQGKPRPSAPAPDLEPRPPGPGET